MCVAYNVKAIHFEIHPRPSLAEWSLDRLSPLETTATATNGLA